MFMRSQGHKNKFLYLLKGLIWCSVLVSPCACSSQNVIEQQPIPGAQQLNTYVNVLLNKRVAVVANQTSLVNHQHLIDTLMTSGVEVVRIFAPEHGFRGKADAGEHIKDGKDIKTGLPIYSLYGSNKKPTAAQLQDVDIVLFDIQDVGTRFYTYLSTLHYVLQACGEQGIPVMVLDRPNPNIQMIDGPIMQSKHQSFVGLHPVPIVYGMTIGEYAQMLVGENWIALNDTQKVELSVVPIQHYTRKSSYDLPVPPSPNLKSMQAVYWYPTLCLFEGTNISIGRGTSDPFTVIGHPEFRVSNYQFTPQANEGAKYPKHEGVNCYGWKMPEVTAPKFLAIHWWLSAYEQLDEGMSFFSPFFYKLAGTRELAEQIVAGKSEKAIRASWQNDLKAFKKLRAPYLIYPETNKAN